MLFSSKHVLCVHQLISSNSLVKYFILINYKIKVNREYINISINIIINKKLIWIKKMKLKLIYSNSKQCLIILFYSIVTCLASLNWLIYCSKYKKLSCKYWDENIN